MKYDLIINGVRFPGQQRQVGISPQAVAAEYDRLIKAGATTYISTGPEDSTLVNWGNVTTVQVVVTDPS